MRSAEPKRHRTDEEAARPRKKFKQTKRQAQYHSSSEDEGESKQRVSDAPRRDQARRHVETAERLKARHDAAKAPKGGILKTAHATPDKASVKMSEVKHDRRVKKDITAASKGEENDDSNDNDGDSAEDLQINTALNTFHNDVIEDDDDYDDENDVQDTIDEDIEELGGDDEPEIDSPASDSDASLSSSQAAIQKQRRKRNDPSAFATSITKILDTKLSTAKRSDPVLSRSKSAAEANKQLADEKLESKARSQIRLERKAASQKGRVQDVLGLERSDLDTGAIMELEKRLKKTAQKGVVRLFNAVRAAQVKSEEAKKLAREQGVIGMGQREERVNEMSKQGFLDLISSGGKQSAASMET